VPCNAVFIGGGDADGQHRELPRGVPQILVVVGGLPRRAPSGRWRHANGTRLVGLRATATVGHSSAWRGDVGGLCEENANARPSTRGRLAASTQRRRAAERAARAGARRV
jgi:hypothetical protein